VSTSGKGGNKWDPILVERPRRKGNDEVPMMEKAMELKRKRNLEPLKGNRFVVLQFDSLKQFAQDVHIKLGVDTTECDEFINKLIGEEKDKFINFALQNPDVLLPVNLDVELNVEGSTLDGLFPVSQSSMLNTQTDMQSPVEPLEDSTTSPMWTEVVRRGESKTRSRLNNNICDERCLLEY
jgi:hypothetical protein